MIKQSLLIADSGGTKTDWCYVKSNGEREYFTTESFHPSQWNNAFKEYFFNFWKERGIPFETSVHFFGAGCTSQENKNKVSDLFKYWGFSNINIQNDLVGAGKALYGNQSGYFAILGTGSVCCKYENNKVTEYFGGFGYLLGDEGSGYYFGRQLIHSLLNSKLDQVLTDDIHGLIGGRADVLDKVYGGEGKFFISSIASQLKDLKNESDILKLHQNNFLEFIDKYVIPNKIKDMSIVGSYAYHHQEILDEIFSKKGICIKKTLQFPIVELTDCLLKGAL
jgi:glucosamine kinase